MALHCGPAGDVGDEEGKEGERRSWRRARHLLRTPPHFIGIIGESEVHAKIRDTSLRLFQSMIPPLLPEFLHFRNQHASPAPTSHTVR